MTVQPTTIPVDILADSDIVHVGCCRHEQTALCGTHDNDWFDVDELPDCVVCLDIEAETDTCPIDGGHCEGLEQ
jgi:hypothetical protein